MTPKEAIAVVAQHVVAAGVERAEWEDYPWIGESDWEDILAEAVRLAQYPPTRKFGAAYKLLESRVEDSEPEGERASTRNGHSTT